MGISSSDTAAINTIDGIVDTLTINLANLAPVYGNQSVAPADAAGTAIAAAGAWTLGAATGTIFTATTSTVIGIHLYDISALGTYQVNLYYAGTLFCSAVFSLAEVAVVNHVYIPVRSARVTGAITAKLESAAGGSETAKIKLVYV